MGSEKVLEKVKKQGVKFIIGGSILFIPSLLISVAEALLLEDSFMFLIFIFPFILGLIMIIVGVKFKTKPLTSGWFKKNPNLLKQADELFSDVVYEDNFIICSRRVIGNKKNLTQMLYLDEAIWIYERKMTHRFITTLHTIAILTLDQNMEISVYAKSQIVIQDLLNKLGQLCSNAKIGAVKENYEYYQQQKHLYQCTSK